MSRALAQFRKRIRRRAVVMEIGGFRPTASPLGSWFGRVNVALPGEEWPSSEGKPMHALCQVNLTELPFRPARLDDVELITVFIGAGDLPIDEANGSNWCLRAYADLRKLVPLSPVKSRSKIKALPMRPTIIEEDFPCWDDVADNAPADMEGDDYEEQFPNVGGFKLGGWPTLVQAEIFWAPFNKHPSAPEYVFQIDTTQKGNWMWGDNGVGYFGRGTARGRRDEWALQWVLKAVRVGQTDVLFEQVPIDFGMPLPRKGRHQLHQLWQRAIHSRFVRCRGAEGPS